MRFFFGEDCVGSITNWRSTLRYFTYIWGNLVTWWNKKQFVVVQSSVEAEFRVMTHGICDGMRLKRLLNELQILVENSIKMFYEIKLP